MSGNKWTESEDRIIAGLWRHFPSRIIRRYLPNRSVLAIKDRATKHHGITKRGKHFSCEGVLLEYVAVAGDDDCWPWTGSVDTGGYGTTPVPGFRIAHRLAAYVTGMAVDGKDVLHTCDNKRCCNPAHLYVGGDSENQMDVAARGRKNSIRLTPEKVREIRHRYNTGCVTLQQLADEVGLCVSAIGCAIRGYSWWWVDGWSRPASRPLKRPPLDNVARNA